MIKADWELDLCQILGLPSFEGIDSLLELVGLSGTGKKRAPVEIFI